MKLQFDAYLDAIAEEIDRIVDLATDAPSMLILARPGSRMSDLLAELNARLSRWRLLVASEDDASNGGDLTASGVDPVEALASIADALLDTLREADRVRSPADDEDDGEELISEEVARLAALTCAIYRSDIERSSGRSGRIETELATDGIDERLDTYCLRVEAGSIATRWEGTMCLIALDAPDVWMVEGRHGQCSWRKGRGPAVTAVVGHASDLLLFAWGRLSPDDLAVTGDFRVAGEWGGVFG